MNIHELVAEEINSSIVEVVTTGEFVSSDVILDIRSQDEQESCPLTLANVAVKKLPFYKLSSHFCELDQSKSYLIYCDRGVMSRLQALYLREQGFKNVKVYLP